MASVAVLHRFILEKAKVAFFSVVQIVSNIVRSNLIYAEINSQRKDNTLTKIAYHMFVSLT